MGIALRVILTRRHIMYRLIHDTDPAWGSANAYIIALDVIVVERYNVKPLYPP